MLRNYVKIACRTLWKQKGVTAINVLGLAAGMAVCLLVGLLFWDQLTYDAFHPGADRLYRVTKETKTRGQANTSPGLAAALREQVASVDAATQLERTRQNVMVDNQAFEARGYYADSSFFDVFGFELVAGSEEEALSAPHTAVITKDLAQQLYGEAAPIGNTFRLADSTMTGPFTVTGVLDREAYRSHLAFDVLYSLSSSQTLERSLSYTYIRLERGHTPSTVASAFQKVGQKHLFSESRDPRKEASARLRLQAVSAIPLSGTRFLNDNAKGMLSPTVAYFLGGLALLVLLTAGFNYVNLSTARSLTRGREVAIRKSLGAHRRQVIGQFLAEAVIVALLAFALATLFLQGLVPAFNQLSTVREAGWQIKLVPGLPFYSTFLLFAGLVGAFAGLYPAWHLSTFQPARVLKASAQSQTPGFEWLTLRKALVILQFAVVFVVAVTATLLYQQTRHMSAAEQTGIRIDDLVHVRLQEASYSPFQQEAQQIQGVERVGGANRVPLGGVRSTGALVQSDRVSEKVSSQYYAADYEFVEAISPFFLATADWSEERFESGQAVLINETAARRLGFDTPQDVLGQSLSLSRFRSTRSVTVVGVIRDFYFQFAEVPSQPLMFHYNPSEFNVAVAQVGSGQEGAVLSALGATWNQVNAESPLQARPYHELIQEETAPLTDAGWVLAVVAGLAVLIGCLGLLGITTYTVQTRTREIGIRKALGATVSSIVGLLSKDILWLVGVAVGMGLPAAWWMNQQWLRSFAYRIDLGIWTFLLSTFALVALVLLAIAPQTIRAARTDPATTLRDE